MPAKGSGFTLSIAGAIRNWIMLMFVIVIKPVSSFQTNIRPEFPVCWGHAQYVGCSTANELECPQRFGPKPSAQILTMSWFGAEYLKPPHVTHYGNDPNRPVPLKPWTIGDKPRSDAVHVKIYVFGDKQRDVREDGQTGLVVDANSRMLPPKALRKITLHRDGTHPLEDVTTKPR